MIHSIQIAAWVFICFAATAMASEQGNIDGFGVARWGMFKKDILAAEGTPTDIDKNSGEITYNDKMVMGKKTIVKYMFEAGCTDFDISQCRFSEGTYIFNDVSKEFLGQMEESLTTKYGLPTTTETTTKSYPTVAKTGKCEVETQTSVRIRGKASITYSRECSLYDFFSKITNKEVKAGACRATVSYYGPYYYQARVNRAKTQDRGL